MVMVPKQDGKSGKVRIQLDLLRSQAVMFDELASECGLDTRKELFNAAMTLFYWAVKETKNNRKIASYDPSMDSVETVIMPALEFVGTHNAIRQNDAAQDRQNSSSKRSRFSVVSDNNTVTT